MAELASAALAAESVRVFVDAWKLMVGRLPGSVLLHDGGVSTSFGNVPMPFFNVSIPDHPLLDSDAWRNALQLSHERAALCKHPWLMGVCEAWAPSGWAEIATAEFGLAPAMCLTGMAASILLPPRRPVSTALEYRRVTTPALARDLAVVNAFAYGMPPSLFEGTSDMSLWHDDTLAYVGYQNDRAVTAAAAFPVSGTVYIAFVATMPEEHGQGFAESVMRHVIAKAQQSMGCTRVMLHATDMGRPIYAAMGFEPAARFHLLSPKH